MPIDDLGTGRIMPLPDDSDTYAGMTNFMPDEPFPVGCQFATRHPILIDPKPYMQTYSDGSTGRLRSVVQSL